MYLILPTKKYFRLYQLILLFLIRKLTGPILFFNTYIHNTTIYYFNQRETFMVVDRKTVDLFIKMHGNYNIILHMYTWLKLKTELKRFDMCMMCVICCFLIHYVFLKLLLKIII